MCQEGFDQGLLRIDESRPGKEKLVAKFRKGPAFEQLDLGEPTGAGGTAYALCLYDDQDLLVSSLNIDRPAALCGTKPCWTPLGGTAPMGKGYRYNDREATADGVSLVKLRGGAAGQSSVLVKAANRADRGRLSMPVGVAAAFEASASATMRLVSDDGLCLSHSVADIRKQNVDGFVAR